MAVDHVDFRKADRRFLERPGESLPGRSHQFAVKRAAHDKQHGTARARGPASIHRPFHRRRFTGYDGLAGCVVVGRRYHPVRLLTARLHLPGVEAENGRHGPLPPGHRLLHEQPAPMDEPDGIEELQRAAADKG